MKKLIKTCFWYLVTLNESLLNFLLKISFLLLRRSKQNGKLYTQNAEGHKEFYIDFNKERKHGISGIARLRNSAEFLETVIINQIELYDEIILINNKSTDSTKEVCQKLLLMYPNKIRCFEYPFEIHKPYSEGHKKTQENSIHSLPYYYNRCFSLSSYDIVTKLDDDNLLLNELVDIKALRNKILKMAKNTFLTFSGLNVINDKGRYLLLPLQDRLAGVLGDHGFYYYDKKCYYYKDEKYEKLNRLHLKWERLGFIYVHLKYLKKDMTYDSDIRLFKYNKKVSKLLASQINIVQ